MFQKMKISTSKQCFQLPHLLLKLNLIPIVMRRGKSLFFAFPQSSVVFFILVKRRNLHKKNLVLGSMNLECRIDVV